jgi:PPOX class probable F420-dependent enzyme
MIEVPPEVAERLASEQVIWLTTTRTDGMPLPNPVWFLWNGHQFLVFTEPTSVKMKNMARNERVALNLNTDFNGGSVAIFQAEANLHSAPADEAELDAYLSKYEEGMRRLGLSSELLVTNYQLIRLTPVKFRSIA